MRKRIHKVANFLAFNLLFFALYLNFIYKDPAVAADKNHQEAASAFSGALTDEKPVAKKEIPASTTKPAGITAASKGTH
jgi:hypothetical protein